MTHLFRLFVGMTALTGTLLTGAARAEELHCGGTEPFWGMTVKPGQEAVFTLAGEKDAATAISDAVIPRGLGPSFIQVYRPAKKAKNPAIHALIVKQVSCSDGMSEYEYPLEVLVDTGGDLYYGCCYSDEQPRKGGEAE